MDELETVAKTQKVISSCTNLKQWESARRYVNLTEKMLSKGVWYALVRHLLKHKVKLEGTDG